MKKRIIALIIMMSIIVAGIAVPIVGADNPAQEKKFSLQQAIDYALENSPLIGISDTGVQKQKVNLKEARSAYNDADKTPIMAFEQFLAKEGYYFRMAEMALTLAEKGQIQTKEAIKFTVENSYFGLLHARENVDIQRSILESAKANMDIANKKYELGMIAEIELLSFKTAYSQAQMNEKAAIRALEYAKMDFNKTLGLPLQTKITLTDSLRADSLEGIDLEQGVSQALVNRFEIIRSKEQHAVNKIKFEITASWYPSNTYKHQQAKYDVESSAYDLTNSTQAVELSVRKAHMDMLNAYETVSMLDETVSQIEKLYQVTKMKFDVGMATSNEVLEALNKLEEIKLKKSQALLGYNLSRKQYQVSYGVGLAGAAPENMQR